MYVYVPQKKPKTEFMKYIDCTGILEYTRFSTTFSSCKVRLIGGIFSVREREIELFYKIHELVTLSTGNALGNSVLPGKYNANYK